MMPDLQVNKPISPAERLNQLRNEQQEIAARINAINNLSDLSELQDLGKRAGEIKREIAGMLVVEEGTEIELPRPHYWSDWINR